MNNKQHLKAIENILNDLENIRLSPQDKIAALRSAATILENNLTAELTFEVFKKTLT